MLVLLACLAIGLGALYVYQRRLIYLPTRMTSGQFKDAVAGAFGDRVSIVEPFDAIVLEPAPMIPVRGTAIWFHGNAGLGLDRAFIAPAFTRRGLRLILAEYPGYGARGGAPTETTLVADADALYARVSTDYRDSPIVLVGESLGTGVVAEVAAHQAARPPSRLVLLTPFLSLAETAARAFWYLPARYLVRDRFDSARHVSRYAGPVAILVAGKDEVVGAAQGRALAQLAQTRGEMVYVELPEAGHNSWSALIQDAQWTELLGMTPVKSAPGGVDDRG
jgi:alpha-beta hydrolase superfamily lysophospholipase